METRLTAEVMEQMDYETFVEIIANIPSCIFFKDTDLRYRFSSHCWSQLQTEHIVGKTDLEIRKDTENAVMGMEADREIIRTRKGRQYTIESDIDGEISYLELIKEPIIDSNGKVLGIVGLINDVTEKTIMARKIVNMSEMLEVKCSELESSNAELQVTLEQIERMFESQRMFTASMNHELRSPLNGIIGNLSLLMDDENLDEECHDLVENAFVSSKLMLEIVNDLLDYAQLEMSGFKIKHEPFSLFEILNNIELQIRVQAKAKNLEFNMIRGSGLQDRLIGDGIRITQIMHNLLSNAVKYTEKGSITLGVIYFNDRLIITCKDTGQGIAEESLDSLFDPFVRLNEKKNANIQGTGLGLSVVKKIIDSMGGEITVTSQLGEGSTFNVVLPVEVDAEPAEPETGVKYYGNPETIDFGKLKVLCVDDSEVSLRVLATMLASVSMSVDEAGSGEEAIARANEYKYDVIIVDHMMPGMDGIEVYDHIRAGSSLNVETPVIMLTGNGDSAHAKMYKEKGLSGYLVKPIMKEQVLEVIESVISKN